MNPRAVAAQGIGFGAKATALQGFIFVRASEGARVTRVTARRPTSNITTREGRATIFARE